MNFSRFGVNVYTNYRRDSDGKLIKNQYGELVRDTVANFTNFKDGDTISHVFEESEDWKNDSVKAVNQEQMYASSLGNSAPRISDHSRIYKGGSWKDRPYWLSPGAVRFMDERKSTNDIGFPLCNDSSGSLEYKIVINNLKYKKPHLDNEVFYFTLEQCQSRNFTKYLKNIRRFRQTAG